VLALAVLSVLALRVLRWILCLHLVCVALLPLTLRYVRCVRCVWPENATNDEKWNYIRMLTTLENLEISGNLLILENSGQTQGI